MAEYHICQEEDSVNNLETPCACSGSLKHSAKMLFPSCYESIKRFRAPQFDLVKSAARVEGDVISVNMVVFSCVENGPVACAGVHEGDELIEIIGTLFLIIKRPKLAQVAITILLLFVHRV